MQRIFEDHRENEYQDDGTGMKHGAFSTNAPKVIPYDTGKVRIGCRWEPPPYIPTHNEVAIQSMILDYNDRRAPWWHRIMEVFK